MLLVLLDEMNLARIEYYFSEFLSRLEGRPFEGRGVGVPAGSSLSHPSEERRLALRGLAQRVGERERLPVGKPPREIGQTRRGLLEGNQALG